MSTLIARVNPYLAVLGVGWLVPILKMAAGDSPRAQLRELWRELGVPVVAILFFLAVWAAVAARIETSLGTLPGPAAVWAEARNLVDERHPRPAEFKGLRDAQLTIARLYGFPNLQGLSDAVELRLLGARTLEEQAELFMSNACLRYNGDDRAHRYRLAAAMLEQEPRIAEVNLYSALTAGRLDAVRRALARDASKVNEPGGPLGRPPLLYLTYSRVPAERRASSAAAPATCGAAIEVPSSIAYRPLR